MKNKYSLLLSLLFLIFIFPAGSYAQSGRGTLTGTIVSAGGKPAASVSVLLKNTTFGTRSDSQGIYQFQVPAGNYTLQVSGIGFASQEKKVVVTAGNTTSTDFVLHETAQQLQEVTITGVRAITGMGYLDEVSENVIYVGKKTEVLLLDSLDANTAQNNPRQVLGRVPGANYSETEGSGFPSNGIGFRGLNPTQSVETNTRQNGYNLTADLYGYPESYYLPPLEAVERIEVTRGASSLQFGPQFGGVINYVLRNGNRHKPLEVTSQQTGGSFGLFNSYNSAGGQSGKWNYFAFVRYQSTQGWRPNSQMQQVSAYGKISYQASSRLTLGVEYSLLRNRIQMPGGFTDEQFAQNSRASYRSRNWLKSPWNIATLTADWKLSDNTSLSVRSATNLSSRQLVWKNEDGGAAQADSISPLTNTYENREVENEQFRSNTTEIRMLARYHIGNQQHTLAAGIRTFFGHMKRQGGGKGTTGSDFDLSLVEDGYEYDIDFTTTNYAFFAENTFRLTDKLTLTPGFRYEFLHSTARGFNPDAGGNGTINYNRSKNRNLLLAGVGLQYKTSVATNLYANVSQAYKPIDYSNLQPFGTVSSIDPNLKDATGYNADAGWRGSVRDFLNFDVGGFYLRYNNRIGIVIQNGNSYRTNTGNSEHYGLESYVEFNPVRAFVQNPKWSLSVFNSLAVIHARYVSGEADGNPLAGKQVEYAPRYINRSGITVAGGGFSATLLLSATAKSYGDALNTEIPDNDAPQVGVIPAYTVADASATYKIRQYTLKLSINNLTDKRYFTKRTDEYPGPGIIPSIGRSISFGIGARF